MKKIITALLTLFIFSTLVIFKKKAIITWAQGYATKAIQEKYGSQPLSAQYQERIRSIADRMKITEAFQIRKMNTFALQSYGYHNAIAVQTLLFNLIPIGAESFLFMSEGFFQDLSPEEQTFLIGHELVHIEQGHLRYYTLIFYLALLMVLLCVVVAVFKLRFKNQLCLHLSVSLIFLVISYCGLAYKRSIEQEADLRSLSALQSHDGCLALIKRWQKEFKIPLHNEWWGLFADHPSCHERIQYVTNHKQQQEGKSHELC